MKKTALTLTLWIGSRISGLTLRRTSRGPVEIKKTLHHFLLSGDVASSVQHKRKDKFIQTSDQMKQN